MFADISYMAQRVWGVQLPRAYLGIRTGTFVVGAHGAGERPSVSGRLWRRVNPDRGRGRRSDSARNGASIRGGTGGAASLGFL